MDYCDDCEFFEPGEGTVGGNPAKTVACRKKMLTLGVDIRPVKKPSWCPLHKDQSNG